VDEWDEDEVWGVDAFDFVKKPTKTSIVHFVAFFFL
jgi:hypothetical protein